MTDETMSARERLVPYVATSSDYASRTALVRADTAEMVAEAHAAAAMAAERERLRGMGIKWADAVDEMASFLERECPSAINATKRLRAAALAFGVQRTCMEAAERERDEARALLRRVDVTGYVSSVGPEAIVDPTFEIDRTALLGAGREGAGEASRFCVDMRYENDDLREKLRDATDSHRAVRTSEDAYAQRAEALAKEVERMRELLVQAKHWLMIAAGPPPTDDDDEEDSARIWDLDHAGVPIYEIALNLKKAIEAALAPAQEPTP